MNTYRIAVIPGDGVVLDAIEAVLEDGLVRTTDLGGSSSTSQVGDAIVGKLG